MARHMLLVLSNPTRGKEAEYRRWYVEQHIPDVLKLPGWVSGKLMHASAPDCQPQPGMAERWRYAAVFQLDTDNLSAAINDMKSRLGTPSMPMSDAFNMADMHVTVFDDI